MTLERKYKSMDANIKYLSGDFIDNKVGLI